jgi:hypothetical protein
MSRLEAHAASERDIGRPVCKWMCATENIHQELAGASPLKEVFAERSASESRRASFLCSHQIGLIRGLAPVPVLGSAPQKTVLGLDPTVLGSAPKKEGH